MAALVLIFPNLHVLLLDGILDLLALLLETLGIAFGHFQVVLLLVPLLDASQDFIPEVFRLHVKLLLLLVLLAHLFVRLQDQLASFLRIIDLVHNVPLGLVFLVLQLFVGLSESLQLLVLLFLLLV